MCSTKAQVRLVEPGAGGVDAHSRNHQRLVVGEPALAGLERLQPGDRVVDDLVVARRLGRIEALDEVGRILRLLRLEVVAVGGREHVQRGDALVAVERRVDRAHLVEGSQRRVEQHHAVGLLQAVQFLVLAGIDLLRPAAGGVTVLGDILVERNQVAAAAVAHHHDLA